MTAGWSWEEVRAISDYLGGLSLRRLLGTVQIVVRNGRRATPRVPCEVSPKIMGRMVIQESAGNRDDGVFWDKRGENESPLVRSHVSLEVSFVNRNGCKK